MLAPQQKAKVITKAATHEGDTGSPEVQISLFTEEIERLAKHLKKHVKDISSRRGLLKMVAKRKRMLDFLKREDPTRHGKIVKSLGLRG
ncbi:MAG: 30S ribosomal protein S15 [Patescibacteria group bacterium]